MKIIDNYLRICFFLWVLASFLKPVNLFAVDVVSNKMIWEGKNYAAFTSLVYYKGFFYCAFRNANKHYDPTGEDCGVIKIIRSKNSNRWEEFLSFEEDGYDLRDPQLSITPDNKIMLLTEKVKYKDGKAIDRQSCISFIQRKGRHTPLSPVNFTLSMNYNWIWNPEWINGVSYGFTYVPYFAFVKSVDGINWQLLNKIDLDNTPTEASLIAIDSNNFIAVVRRNANALVGEYNTNTNQWVWHETSENVGCPKIIVINNDIFVLGRSQGAESQTAIYQLNKNNFSLDKVVSLKGKKDCAYPGAVYRDGVLFVTYYSGDGKNGDVYLAKISLNKK